ncbi:MAG: carboxypeptidase-like regulatory domain-containing protein [Gammaproteobacteria bacterium]
MGAFRYLLFAVIGIVIASAMFLLLNVLVNASHDAGTGFIERWIIRATCAQYELRGSVRDANGKPVPYAVVEVTYLEEQLSTRSGVDGSFVLKAAEPVCDQAPPANVTLLVQANEFRPKRQSLGFEVASVDVRLEPREFRP